MQVATMVFLRKASQIPAHSPNPCAAGPRIPAKCSSDLTHWSPTYSFHLPFYIYHFELFPRIVANGCADKRHGFPSHEIEIISYELRTSDSTAWV